MQEGDNLPTGTDSGGGEVIAARPAGDFFLYRPSHSLRIVRVAGDISKISLASGRGASCRLPHIFHRHGAGAVCICAGGGPGHQALFSGPQSCFIKIIGTLNIGERIRLCRFR